MNVLDIVLAVIACFFCVRGLIRGFIMEISGIVGLIGGFIFANNYYMALTPHIQGFVSESWRDIVAYISIFICVMLFCAIIAMILRKILQAIGGGIIDRLGGFIAGSAKALILCSIIVLLLYKFIPTMNFVAQSLVAPYVARIAEYLLQFVPHTVL